MLAYEFKYDRGCQHYTASRKRLDYMSLLNRLFGNKNQSNNNSTKNTALVARSTTTVQMSKPMLMVHPDIQKLLWIADGESKNYVPTVSNKTTFKVKGLSFTVSFTSIEEPSLIYMRLPISDISGNVERPPYFPMYSGLTPEQRGMYWKLLTNPYDDSIDIGYVFILYYGLERYLMTDKYEETIDLILKLRDVHQNKSFQSYTANAVILTCLQRQRADIVQKFMGSLDKEYEFNFSPNLFLLCKYALGLNLTGNEIMRMAKAFEFTNNNYLKKYPELFLETLLGNIKAIYGLESISWDKLITASEFNKLPLKETTIYANVSIMDKSIKVPSLLDSFKFKKKVYDLLEKTHEDVKKKLSDMRKNGEKIKENKQASSTKKSNEVLSFDTMQESTLLNSYYNARENSLEQHFASIALQDFYYKYRSYGQEYIDKCVSFCRDDISKLPEIQKVYVEDEKAKILSYQWLTAEEKQTEILDIKPFFANIPAFKRLAIIYEKEKDYDKAISICDAAIEFYSSGDMQSAVSEFDERKKKLINKNSQHN